MTQGFQISPLGWVLIGLLVLMVISLNISLITSLRHKKSGNNWLVMLQQSGKNLKDPFHDENARMQELADRVENLKHNENTSENNGNQIVGDGK